MLFTIPAALAADHASLTIYHAGNDALFSGGSQGTIDAGHALIHETRTLDLAAGSHEVRIGGLPATVDPEAIAVAFGDGSAVAVHGRRVVLADATASGALDGAIGSEVSVLTGNLPVAVGGGGFNGVLLGASDGGLLVRTADGKVHFIHEYTSVTLPPDSVAGGSSLLLDVHARTAGTRTARLTYGTSGIGWRAAYTATLADGRDCRMQFDPEASIANRSGTDYRAATIRLIAGQPNLGHRVPMFRVANAPMAMAAAQPMPQQSTLGDYRSFTLPGTVNLASGTVTLAPLYPSREIACQREYLVDDGGASFPSRPRTSDSGARDYQDRPIATTLAFTAPEALPAGTLRAWTTGDDGVPALLGEGGIGDTPKGQRVAVQLGQSFDLRASRERTAFDVDARAGRLDEAFRITLHNGGATQRTVTVREHPDRWRAWTLTSSSRKPTRQTTQLVEFQVPVPAHGEAVLDYAVRYTWTPADMQ